MSVLLVATGAVWSHIPFHTAAADSVTVTPTIYVPAEGLTFRAPDGGIIATLSRDAHGSFLEVVNSDGFSTTRIPSAYCPGPGF